MKFLYPNWPAPKNIKAAVTLVPSGLDLALSNETRPAAIQQLVSQLKLPTLPIWLKQVHSNQVIWADKVKPESQVSEADASIANFGETVCAVLSADCLPILLCDLAGQQIAAIHAGWRGQVAGIIEATIKTMTVPANKLLVWLGPAISGAVYEVGIEVYEQLIAMEGNVDKEAFLQVKTKDKWLLNLSALAKGKLQALGVPALQIFGGDYCTYSNSKLFYSYRRTKTKSRMASLIWFTR